MKVTRVVAGYYEIVADNGACFIAQLVDEGDFAGWWRVNEAHPDDFGPGEWCDDYRTLREAKASIARTNPATAAVTR